MSIETEQTTSTEPLLIPQGYVSANITISLNKWPTAVRELEHNIYQALLPLSADEDPAVTVTQAVEYLNNMADGGGCSYVATWFRDTHEGSTS
jgi:hypothetical protein